MSTSVAWPISLSGTAVALELFSKWKPPKGTTFHQFVGRLDAEGGFAVVETDNPSELLDSTGKFAPYNVFQVYPVVDYQRMGEDGAAGCQVQGVNRLSRAFMLSEAVARQFLSFHGLPPHGEA